MRDKQLFEQLTNAVSLGVLAEEMVLAAGHAVARRPLDEHETEVLRTGQQLLAAIASTTLTVVPTPGPRRMDTDAAYLEAFRAVRLEAPGERAQDYLNSLCAVIEKAASGREISDNDIGVLRRVQDLFARVGEMSLVRAGDLFEQPRKEPLPWTRMRASSAF
jgi:hypothetical protein